MNDTMNYRASAAYVWKHCAGYALFTHANTETDAMRTGTAVHAELSKFLVDYFDTHTGFSRLLHALAASTGLSDPAQKMLTHLHGIFGLVSVTGVDIDTRVGGNAIGSGTPDLVVHTTVARYVVDFKNWYEATPSAINAARHQLGAYAYHANATHVVIVWPDGTRRFLVPYLFTDIERSELLAESEAIRRGEWCGYCPARRACPLHVSENAHLCGMPFDALQPVALKAQVKAANALLDTCELLASRGALPGWSIGTTQTRRYLTPGAAERLAARGIYGPPSPTDPRIPAEEIETRELKGLVKSLTYTEVFHGFEKVGPTQ